MKTIYKYQIPIEDSFYLSLPKGAKILKFDSQNDTPCIWALVDTKEENNEKRNFRLAGTGHPLEDENLKYIDTTITYEGQLVWHLFEIIK